MPNLSFLGHLAGILNGTLEYYGALDFLYVGNSFLIHLESLGWMRKLVELDSFVATTTQGQQIRADAPLVLPQPIRRILCVIKDKLASICGRNRFLRVWRSGNDVEFGVIRPPEFYNGRFALSSANDTMSDDDDEREPLASQMV